ncbi:response regulator transcription factor [Pelagibius litoralis]|uniref:Response regulator transcription factor n=1 Tax=Pelagibius litoralis TaxID=374515 RepID=A0A967KAR9_9PROT|nr:LuxR C-terminal-related transcriptional regulator [Pelagibius litoralis]NIA71788.1 response regulator transcription factor [Pelagibius litoralis]
MYDRNTQPPGPQAETDHRRCALLASGIDTAPLLDALRRVPNTRIGDICIFPANGLGEPEADYLILAVEDGSRLGRLEQQIDRWSGEKTRVLLAVPESKCAFLGDLAQRADGLILLDAGLDYLEESLSLAREGYSVMPAPRDGGSGTYCHLDMLCRLNDSEQAILKLLAIGDSNRSIAEQLNESETRVKSLVRAILVKLECRNRTEAAVLAATVLLPLQESLHKNDAGDGKGPTSTPNGTPTKGSDDWP